MSAVSVPVLQRAGGLFTPLTAAAALSFLLGAVFMAFASLFGDSAPWVLVGLAVAPLVALVVLAVPFVGAVLVFATLPVGSVGAPLGFITVQAVEAAVLVVGLLLALRRMGEGRVPLPWSPALTWALALVGWTLVSLYSAIDTALALKQVISLVGGLVFASVVLAACQSIRDIRILMGAFTGAVTLLSITALSGGGTFETRFGGQAVVSGRLQGAFDHPNQLGSVCAMAAPIAVALVLGTRTARARGAAAIATLLIFAALMLSLSRGAWIGAGLALVLMLISLPEARRLLMALAVPAVIAALFVSSVVPTSPALQVVEQRARALTELSPYDDRDAIYAEANREIRADPLTGVGPGGFPIASARAGSESSTVAAKHAHNLGLTWAAESGLPALLLIIGFAVALTLDARYASRRLGARSVKDRALVVGLGGALVSVVGQGFFDYTLRNAVVHIAMWGVIGALLACRREADRSA